MGFLDEGRNFLSEGFGVKIFSSGLDLDWVEGFRLDQDFYWDKVEDGFFI